MLFPPIAMKAKYFVLLYAAAELVFGLQNIMPGVAHFAHLGGAVFGLFLLVYWRKFDKPRW
jgi:membrane associated rhomboid family serine protease